MSTRKDIRDCAVMIFGGSLPFYLAVLFCVVAISQGDPSSSGGNPFLLLILSVGTYLLALITNLQAIVFILRSFAADTIAPSWKVVLLLAIATATLVAPPVYIQFLSHPGSARH
jgi:hypothetical protein